MSGKNIHNLLIYAKTCVLSWFLSRIHGAFNNERENVNNVDLNRNFDYYWENGKGKEGVARTLKALKYSVSARAET